MQTFEKRRLLVESLEDRRLLASFRSIDGLGNNPTPQGRDFGVAETQLIRFGYPAEYPGGVQQPPGPGAPAGSTSGNGDQITDPGAPNPRDVSNALSAQSDSVFSARNLSDWIVQWGQFLTHDMDLTGTDAANNVLSNGSTGDFSIPITDANDPLGPNPIRFNRSNFDPATGDNTQVGNPRRINWREQINHITSFIDASNVYGSDATRADNLRTFVDGKLETTAGGLLPGLNDVGEENDNAVRHEETDLFLAGDVRANEQVGLTATHALFVREHNRLADSIKENNPSLTDEEIYQWARKIVGAEMQIITYEEFLPALMGNRAPNPNAHNYANNIDPSITTSFATAFFRFGHSQQSSTLKLVDDGGAMTGEFSLANIFFNPDILQEDPALVDEVLKGLASQVSQETDLLVVDEVRNFLFGPPGAGGLDLVALDIQRGRDHGLVDFNENRMTYGLPRLNSFAALTSDPALHSTLQSLYPNLDSIDAWIGALAEDHLPGASIGEMLNASFIDQFTRLRDGDRFFYTSDPDLNDPIVTGVIDLDSLTLSSVIQSNTQITNLQNNVFFTAAGFSVVHSDAATIVSEDQQTDTFTVTLNRAPASRVVLDIASNDPTETTAETTRLVFTPNNWHVAQPVVIAGVADGINDGDQTTTISISVDDGASDDSFDGVTDQAVSVTTTDLVATPGFSVTPTGDSTSAFEGGANRSFDVVLDAMPSSDVVLQIDSSDPEQLIADPGTLTFNATNWDQPQIVVAIAVDDVVADGDQSETISVSVLASASDDSFDELSAQTLEIVTRDNETTGVSFSPNALTLSEDPDATPSGEYGFVLTDQPTADVVFTVANGDTSEIQVDVTTLTFTPEDWDSPHVINVTAIDDDTVDGTQSTNLTIMIDESQSPSQYSGLTVQVPVSITDNDVAAFVVSETDDATVVSESGDTDSVTVVLSRQPTSDVVLTIAANSNSLVSDLASLTFTPENWSEAQTVTLSTPDDQLMEGDESVELTISVDAENSASGFGSVEDQLLSVQVTDDELAGVVVTPLTGLETNEGGGQATFTVQLTSLPTEDVTIALSSSNEDEATLSVSQLMFTTEDALDLQTVTVTGVDDDILDGAIDFTIILSATISEAENYNGIDPDDVSGVNADNEVDRPFHNHRDKYDVNDDDAVSARDALLVINDIGRNGARVLPSQRDDGMHYVDVNNDLSITALDALQVINFIGRGQGQAESELSQSSLLSDQIETQDKADEFFRELSVGLEGLLY